MPLTINGIHLSEAGDRIVAGLLMQGLGFQPAGQTAGMPPAQFEQLRDLVRDKNQQFFYRWRPVNGEYVVGRRVEPFGAVNFRRRCVGSTRWSRARSAHLDPGKSAGGLSPAVGERR